MMSENNDAVQPNTQPSRRQAVTRRRSRSGRRPKRRHEKIYRSIDAPWLGEAMLLGLQFWTVEDFACHAKITVEQVQEWIEAGLPTLQFPDGTVRISEAAADEWAREKAKEAPISAMSAGGRSAGASKRLQADGVVSPYLDSEQAAAYLGLPSVKALYGLRDRGRLKPLPGHRRLRFTKQQLDNYLEGRKK